MQAASYAIKRAGQREHLTDVWLCRECGEDRRHDQAGSSLCGVPEGQWQEPWAAERQHNPESRTLHACEQVPVLQWASGLGHVLLAQVSLVAVLLCACPATAHAMQLLCRTASGQGKA